MNSDLMTLSPMAAYVGSFTDMVLPAWVLITAATIVHWFALLLPPLALLGYLDRKMGSDIQMRIGPNRVGPFGMGQPVADVIKLFFKQDSGPDAQEPWLFRWGVVAAIVCVFLAIGDIPLAEAWALSNLDAGAVFVIAVLTFSSLCIFWAAYSAQSSWSVLSGFRALSMISAYVVPLAVTTVPPVLIAGSPNLDAIVRAQGGFPWKWIAFNNPGATVACAAMFIALLVWQGRAPFDHQRARGEIAGGFVAEFGGVRKGLVTFLEYASLFLACAFIVAVYLGGWQTPFNLESFGRAANIVQWFVYMVKVFTLAFLSIWIRWSLPSLRADQIVNLSWRILVPMGLAGGIFTAVWLVIFNGKGFGDFL